MPVQAKAKEEEWYRLLMAAGLVHHANHGDSACFAEHSTGGQAATAAPGLVTLAPLLTHCSRQLDRFVPGREFQAHTQHGTPSCHPQSALSFESRPGPVVRLMPQLPALLALSLALPHSVHSMHSTADTEGKTCLQTVLLLQSFLWPKDPKAPEHSRAAHMSVGSPQYIWTIFFVYHLEMAKLADAT